MKVMPAILGLLLAFGCARPLSTIRRSQTATVVVDLPAHGQDRTSEMIRSRLEAELRARLGEHTRVVPQAEATEDTLVIRVRLVTPERAEVPHWAGNLAANLVHNATGHLFDTFQQDFLQLGVVVTPEQRERVEDDPLVWGLFPKTAKRDFIRNLGYTPYLVSGKVDLRSRAYNCDCGTFFGWQTVRSMRPLGQGSPGTGDEAIIASCAGVADYLFQVKLR